jgi:pSer/pThr/pTyr-binding forkhead associated (FHA) protein
MDFELVMLEGPQAGRRLPLGTSAVTFGRSPSAMMSFPQDSFMSSMHLTVQAQPNGILITDMRSTNGSLLNGQPITHSVAVDGDILKIGSLTMKVVAVPMVATSISPSQPAADSAPFHLPVASPPGSKADAVLRVLLKTQGTLFCLLDAASDEMIPALLQVARDQVQIESLYEGNSAKELARWAPYLLRLPPEAPLLRVLIDRGWGKGWASFFTATAAFEDVRKHFRRFLLVQLENGKEVFFRFYDPRVLREFLPTTNSAELATFFGPVKEWIVEGENADEIMLLRRTTAGLERRVISAASAVIEPGASAS